MLQSAPCKEDILPAGASSRAAVAMLSVELLRAEAAASHITAWRSLAADCLEPNPFLEPSFVLPAAHHLAKRGGPHFLFVWAEDESNARKLVALCPLAPGSAFARFQPMRIWAHEQAPLGVPLLAPAYAEAALAAIFSFCRNRLPHAPGLMFPLLPQEGPTAQLLTACAADEGRGIKVSAPHQRAILAAGAEPRLYLRQSTGSERRRKLNKARQSLAARGSVAFQIIRDPYKVQAAAEEFFTLEAKGWKGRRGTAFLKSLRRTAFAREVALKLGLESKYFVARFALDQRPLAMALMLRSGHRAYWWKITYDEEFAAFSPGVLLATEMTRYLLCDPSIALTDSCTTDAQPMIDHIWAERMPIADLFVGLSTDRRSYFEAAARWDELRRKLRSRLKEAISWLRQFLRSKA